MGKRGSGWPGLDTLRAASSPGLKSLRPVPTCWSCHILGSTTGEHGKEEQSREGLLLKLGSGIQASVSNLSSVTRVRSEPFQQQCFVLFCGGDEGKCEHPQAEERGRWRC